MGATNTGNQRILFKFKTPLDSDYMDSTFQDVIDVGIYDGFSVSKVSDVQVTVTAGKVVISDGIYTSLILSQDPVNLSISNANPYIILRWTYTKVQEWYMDYTTVSFANVQSNDIILGKALFTGTTLDSIILDEVKTLPNKILFENIYNNLLVKTNPAATPPSLEVKVSDGFIILSNGIKYTFSEQNFVLNAADITNPRIDIIGIDLIGTIIIRQGTPAAIPTIPTYSGLFGLAEIYVGANVTQIYKENITDVRSFFTQPFSLADILNITDDRYYVQEVIDNKITLLQDQLDSAQKVLLDQNLQLSYMSQKRVSYSNDLYETFTNNLNSSDDMETLCNDIMYISDDNDWNNNWKQVEEHPIYRNGFLKPKKQCHYMEIFEYANLENIGLPGKSGMSRYDILHNCYWMIMTDQSTFDAQLIKFSLDFKKNTTNILGRWYLATPVGNNTCWLDVDVTLNGTHLFIIFSNNQNTLSDNGVVKLRINDDGTLGRNYTRSEDILTWIFPWDQSSDFDAISKLTINTEVYYNAITVWDYTHIGLLKELTPVISGTGVTEMQIEFIELADNGSGAFTIGNPRATIDKLSRLTHNHGDTSNMHGASIIKYGDELWIKINNFSTDWRSIYKFNIIDNGVNYFGDVVGTITGTPEFIRNSGRFNISRSIDSNSSNFVKEGISFDMHGQLLEVTSTSSTGQYISKHAIKNSFWAENQVCLEYKPTSSVYPNTPNACMVEKSGGFTYYWTGDAVVTVNEVDVFRYNIDDGTYKHARITGIGAVTLLDLTTNGTLLYLLVRDGSNNSFIYFGNLATFISGMGNSYNIANTIDITVWGVLSAVNTTNNILSCKYYSDTDLIYIPDSSSYKINTLSSDGLTYTLGVIDLPTLSIGDFRGAAIKNGVMCISHRSGSSTPNRLYCLDISKSTSTKWYLVHLYQDPSNIFRTTGMISFDLDDNDIVGIHHDDVIFMKFKTLHNPQVMQLHTFISSENVLRHSDESTFGLLISSQTKIIERYFKPSEFKNQAVVPDKYYMVACTVFNTLNAVQILNLDKFLNDTENITDYGLVRYDVRKISTIDFYSNNNSILTSNVWFTQGVNTLLMEDVYVEKDMIFIPATVLTATDYFPLTIIDLKDDRAYGIDTTYFYQYADSLSRRNGSGGYISMQLNSFLTLSGVNAFKIHAKTFFKEDYSEYDKQFPQTFVYIGNSSGADILRIDWDSNNNRNFVEIFQNVFNNTSLGRRGGYIADDGTIFAGNDESAGAIRYSNIPIWDIDRNIKFDDDFYRLFTVPSAPLNSSVLGIVYGISENSRIWKNYDGTWRHQLLVCTMNDATNTSDGRLQLLDIEKNRIEVIITRKDILEGFKTIDTYEEYVAGIYMYQNTELRNRGLYLCKRMNTKLGSDNPNGFRTMQRFNHWDFDYPFTRNSRPYMFHGAEDVNTTDQYTYMVKISENFGTVTCGSKYGIQLFHYFLEKDNSEHSSKYIVVDENPRFYHFKNTKILQDSDKLEQINQLANELVFINGSTQTWQNLLSPLTTLIISAENVIYGSGTFRSIFTELVKENNTIGDQFVEGVDFEYNKAIDNSDSEGYNIFDTNIGGAFDANRHLRIVENTKNIKDVTGLNLNVIAKNLSFIRSPKSNECYVDLKNGRFVLPRPNYFSKLETLDNFINAEIVENQKIPEYDIMAVYHFRSVIGKFGNALMNEWTTTTFFEYNDFFYPFSDSIWIDFNTGTISVWFKIHWEANVNNEINIISSKSNTNNIRISIIGTPTSGSIKLYNGTTEEQSYPISNDTWYHLYIIWDRQKTLTGGKSVRVFLDGTERLSTTNNLNTLESHILLLEMYSSTKNDNFTRQWIDNLKIFKDVVSEDPSWEYNGGTGREEALHEIYGVANNYSPVSLQVGYTYNPFNTTDLVLDRQLTGYDGFLKWNFESEHEYGIIETPIPANLGIIRMSTYDILVNDYTDTGDISTTSYVISNLTDTSSLELGMLVSGTNILDLTQIIQIINSTSIRVTKLPTATSTGVSLTFKKNKSNIYSYNVYTTTGDVSGAPTAIITNIPNTGLIRIGQMIFGDNIEQNTYVESIDSSTQITISKNIATNFTGQNINFINIDILGQLIDQVNSSPIIYTNERLHIQIEKNIGEKLSIYFENSGQHNPNSTGYEIKISEFSKMKLLTNSNFMTMLITYHTDYPLELKYWPVMNNAVKNFNYEQKFSGNSSNTIFSLNGENRAFELVSISTNSGATYINANDFTKFTYGTNSPNYDNYEINTTGYTTIKFLEAPTTGTDNIIIRYIPKINRFKLMSRNIQPNEDTYVDIRKKNRLIDQFIEVY